jgi:hypothetical protein
MPPSSMFKVKLTKYAADNSKQLKLGYKSVCTQAVSVCTPDSDFHSNMCLR